MEQQEVAASPLHLAAKKRHNPKQSLGLGGKKEAPPGFEPGMADLQSAALAAWLRRLDRWLDRPLSLSWMRRIVANFRIARKCPPWKFKEMGITAGLWGAGRTGQKVPADPIRLAGTVDLRPEDKARRWGFTAFGFAVGVVDRVRFVGLPARRNQQRGKDLPVESVAEVVGMIDAISGQVAVLLFLENGIP